MPVIDHIDGPNRRIYLHSDTVNAGLTSFDSFYREYRQLRQDEATLQVFESFLRADGNISKGGGRYTPRYITLLNGTRIVPYDTTHQLLVTIEIITDEETSGRDCFDRSPLSATTMVDIDYQPQAFEIIQVSSGSGLSTEEHNRLMAIPTVTLTTEQDEKLMAIPEVTLTPEQDTKLNSIPSETLTAEEHNQLMSVTTDGLLTEQRAAELMYERRNFINDQGLITDTIAGGNIHVETTFQDMIPFEQRIIQ